MKKAFAMLCAVFFFSFLAMPNAVASDLHVFYRWVDAVVDDAYINKDKNKIAVFVNSLFQKRPIIHNYASHLPLYIACTHFAEDIWRENKEVVNAFVVLFDQNAPSGMIGPQSFYSWVSIPNGTCPYINQITHEKFGNQEHN